MTSDWAVVTVGEISRLVTKGTTPTTLGYGFEEQGINFVKVESITDDGYFVPEKIVRISPAAHEALARSKLAQDDILFTIAGTIGRTAVVPENLLPANTNQAVAIVRPDTGRVLPRFLRFVLSNRTFTASAVSRTVQSVQANFSLGELKGSRVYLPPLDEQRAIVGVLGALEDRIALLRETNATLEAIAQALFKSWFVDFDPVRAKSQGLAPAGMDEATAALFPERFDESVQGLLPKGWRFAPVGDVVEGIYDGPHATPPESDEGPVFLGIKNLTGTGLAFGDLRHIAESDFGQWTRRVLPAAGDIVFSYEATLGFFALVPPGLRCCLGRRLALIRPRPDAADGHFFFHQFIAAPFQRLLERHTIQGATVNRIALKQFPSYPVMDPPPKVKAAFDATVAPIWARIHANQAQAQTLTTIRDALLPRLISGQLQLRQIEDATAS